MLRLPKLFGEGCVLQQDEHCRIWGWCGPREEIRLSLKLPEDARQEAEIAFDRTSMTVDARREIRLGRKAVQEAVRQALPETDRELTQTGKTDTNTACREQINADTGDLESILGSARAEADENGRFEAEIQTPPAGGPYLMCVETSHGEKTMVREVYVGEVFVCSGQSNMELPMSRVCERFPEEFREGGAPDVHEYKVTEYRDFRGPLEDHVQAEWRSCTGEKLPEISAFAYFFGKELARVKKVPVGILNLSLGGTPAEAWMSREGLCEWPEALKEADEYKDEEFCRSLTGQEMRAEVDWQREIVRQERGSADAPWKPAVLPGELRDWGLEKFCGCIHLRRTFSVPSDCLQKEGLLRFGTLVDSDTIYINGTRIGETGYRYPPRRYPVPSGLLHEGENEILIRLVCRTGEGRSTAGQPLELVWENDGVYRDVPVRGISCDDGDTQAWGVPCDDRDAPAQGSPAEGRNALTQESTEAGADVFACELPIEDPTGRLCRMALAEREGRLTRVSLAGAWEYQQRAVCGPAPGQTLISWKPTGLFHGMLAPCLPYRVRGALWYQGESNDSRPQTYSAVLEGLIRDWRKNWRQEKLPFVVMQLPNCGVDVAPNDAWPRIREAQALAGRLEDVAATVNLDAGEDNDLHPRDKKTVAARAVSAVRALVYQENVEWRAPEVCGWELASASGSELAADCGAEISGCPDGKELFRSSGKTLGVCSGKEENSCAQGTGKEKVGVRLHFDDRVVLRLRPSDSDAPENPRLFELAGEDGRYHPAMVCVEQEAVRSIQNAAAEAEDLPSVNEGGVTKAGNLPSRNGDAAAETGGSSLENEGGTRVFLHSDAVPCPNYVRYAWFRAPGPLLLYGGNGFCVGPFRLQLKAE